MLYRLRDKLNNSLHQAENGIQAIETSQAPQREAESEETDSEFPSPFRADDSAEQQDDL